MRFEPWRCPECGLEAKGTLETVPGVALLTFEADGEAQYFGDSVLEWNGQETTRDEGGNVRLVCPEGHEWPARMGDD